MVLPRCSVRGDPGRAVRVPPAWTVAAYLARPFGGARAFNEQGLIPRAGLEEAGEVLTAVGWTPKRLEESVARMREVLRLERPQDFQFDAVVRSGQESAGG